MATLSLNHAFSNLSICCAGPRSLKPAPSFISSSFLPSSRAISSTSFHGVGIRVCERRPVGGASSPRVVVAKAAGERKPAPKKKMDSAVKRARIAEVRRVYNKSRKTQIATRIKKVLLAIEATKKATTPADEQMADIEKLIAEAYSIIDKSVKVGTIHQNTGANRKSRLGRAKRAAAIALGLYTPSATA